MQLAVTDLAFDGIETVADKLQQYGIEYIEVIPTKIKPYYALSQTDIVMYKDILADYNLKPYSFLSLFYGIDIKNVSQVDIILTQFNTLINYAKAIGVKKLIFGSPSLRKKIPGWEYNLESIFTKLDIMLKGTGISVIIEPVSKEWGTEFWYDVSEVVDFIQSFDLKRIHTMIDTQNAMLQGDDPSLLYVQYKRHIKHIHIAEPGFGKLKNLEMHMKFSNAIRDYKDVITHEITNKDEFRESIKIFSEIYK
jgi:sugar phosphate isomerase/epimerase